MKLEKPLVFIKVHTTGLKPSIDRIIQITISKHDVDGKVTEGTKLVNPEMPIPEEATKINGINDQMVHGKETFFEISQKLHQFIGDSDIAGFNVEFDLAFLMEEFAKANISFSKADRNVIDLQNIYHTMSPRDFVAAAKQFAGVEYLPGAPISSSSWADSSAKILCGMVERFDGQNFTTSKGEEKTFVSNIKSLAETFGPNSGSMDFKGLIVKREDGIVILNYGKKYKERPLAEVADTDPGYLQWMMDQNSIPKDTKNIILAFLKKSRTPAA